MVILICPRKDCKHEWDCKGKSKFYATCPTCYTKVNIKKRNKETLAKENTPG